MSYTAALTPGEGGWICAETAEAPEAISQGRMLEEAKANVAEALGERAQVTVTPVAVGRYLSVRGGYR
jgi:predicted RNase H-like HicB family nuclease